MVFSVSTRRRCSALRSPKYFVQDASSAASCRGSFWRAPWSAKKHTKVPRDARLHPRPSVVFTGSPPVFSTAVDHEPRPRSPTHNLPRAPPSASRRRSFPRVPLALPSRYSISSRLLPPQPSRRRRPRPGVTASGAKEATPSESQILAAWERPSLPHQFAPRRLRPWPRRQSHGRGPAPPQQPRLPVSPTLLCLCRKLTLDRCSRDTVRHNALHFRRFRIRTVIHRRPPGS